MSPTPRELAVVTGASSGIGAALSRELADRGFDLVLCGRDGAALRRMTAEVTGRGVQAVQVEADLTRPDEVTKLHEQIAASGRPVAVAALNAGVAHGGTFATSDLQADLDLIDLNCRATVHLAKLLLRDMTLTQAPARVMILSSVAGRAPGPYQATYAASKAFLHSFAMGVRHELRRTPVSVTSVMPGPTDTSIFDRGGLRGTRIGEGSKDDPRQVAAQATEAALAGKATVVTGRRANRVQVWGSRLLPEGVLAAAAGWASRPGGAL
jgi:uncharacterized protein